MAARGRCFGTWKLGQAGGLETCPSMHHYADDFRGAGDSCNEDVELRLFGRAFLSSITINSMWNICDVFFILFICFQFFIISYGLVGEVLIFIAAFLYSYSRSSKAARYWGTSSAFTFSLTESLLHCTSQTPFSLQAFPSTITTG